MSLVKKPSRDLCTKLLMHSDLSFLFHSAVHFPYKHYSLPLRLLRTSFNLLFPQTTIAREKLIRCLRILKKARPSVNAQLVNMNCFSLISP